MRTLFYMLSLHRGRSGDSYTNQIHSHINIGNIGTEQEK